MAVYEAAVDALRHVYDRRMDTSPMLDKKHACPPWASWPEWAWAGASRD
ncbi:MAG TPA: hypothetical protein VGH91_11305 [Gammaproteobacteria bacterium]